MSIRVDSYPPDSPSVWGCRAILHSGDIDILPDRHALRGSSRITILLAEKRIMPKVRTKIRELYLKGAIRADEECDVTLYEDPDLLVVGNTNASHGYLYITAYVRPPG